MNNPDPMAEDELDEILWPHPFSGSGKPLQVAVSGGVDDKVFVMPYSMCKAAINAYTTNKIILELRKYKAAYATDLSTDAYAGLESRIAELEKGAK